MTKKDKDAVARIEARKNAYMERKKSRKKEKMTSPVRNDVPENNDKEDRPVKEPKKWPRILKKVPINRDVRIKDLPPQPVFKDEDEKKRFLEMLNEASKNVDWNKATKDAIDSGTLHLDFSGLGKGELVFEDFHLDDPKKLSAETVNRCAEATNRKVMDVNKSFAIPGQVTDEPKFILPVPAKDAGAKIDENDIPEYVLAAFIHPAPGFSLESAIEIGLTVRIAYQRDPEFFEATIRIGELRGLGEQMSIYSLVTKDGAKYAVNGVFTAESMASGKQPRALKLYNYLREKLGLA